MYAGDDIARPLFCLSGGEPRALQSLIMKITVREHANLTIHVIAARVLTSPRRRRTTSCAAK
jgi:hypothetical protein